MEQKNAIFLKILVSLSFLLFAWSVLAQITTWQAPEGFASNRYYQVKVNGTPVPVFDTPIASYAVFDMSGEAKVEVSTMYDVRWVDIRPLRWNLKPEYTGDNQTVYIEGGAVVQGMITATGKKNIKICGRGILDGTFVKEMPGSRHRWINLTDCENIDIIHVEDGATISIHNAGKAHVNNVVFENIRIEDSRQKLFDLAIFSSQYSPDGNRDPEYSKKYYLHGAWDGVQKVPAGKEEYHSKFRGSISEIGFQDKIVTI
jgi:hypothetical protein